MNTETGGEKIRIRSASFGKDGGLSVKELTILTFNTGYACHDTASSFRAHLIKPLQRRRCSHGQIMRNINRMSEFLLQSNADIILLQEVDRHSTRSRGVDQHNHFQSLFPEYDATFAWNYQVKWIPVPLLGPVGKVFAGLTTLFRHSLAEASRIQLPGREYWPRRKFDLCRCMAEHRIPLKNGHNLYVFNLHLSAFDRGGRLREQEMREIKKKAEYLAENGDYVIFGGDWNHELPTVTNPGNWEKPDDWPSWLVPLRPTHTPSGYHWVYDAGNPTVREAHTPYDPGTTYTAVIDGFLLSDNIQVVDVKTHDLNFGPSDHHPVTCTIKLLGF
jgi:endonuclease/exonuclease/phosphatase family metal-dependent hydrolase